MSIPKFSVENPVLVNIIMLAIIIGGVYCGLTLVREMFPETTPDKVIVSAPYPGATPAEIEKGLAMRIEEAVRNVDDVDKVVTNISEGRCSLSVEMTSAMEDIDQAVDDIKAAIDTIPRDELPEDAEEISVFKMEPRLPVIAATIYGEVDERTRKIIGERLRDDLLRIPDVTDLELDGIRKAEITVEVEPEKLVEYGVSLSDVADAIRQANLDLPGGRVKTQRHNVQVRTLGETDDVDAIAQTIVRTTPMGELVRVSDLARVIDGFVDDDSGGNFNGEPAVSATIYKTGDQDAIDIAAKVKAFVAGKSRQPIEWDWLTRLKNAFGVTTEPQRIYKEAYNDPYPANIQICTHSNLARFIESRLDLLRRNGLWGLGLVFLSLLLFLNVRVAFWVMMGLVLSVCGAVILMQLVGATLNLISMFGLIVVLGLIVDDAIVVGENVFSRIENGEDPAKAAVNGAHEVGWPVVIAVLTTIAAFLPLLFIEGRMGDFMGVLPIVVMCALSVSLIEAFSILPSHLAESLKPLKRRLHNGAPSNWLSRLAAPLRRAEENLLLGFMKRYYEPLLRLTVRYRYVTVAAVVALLLIAVGFVGGDRVPFVYLQSMDSETVMVNLDMPVGTPAERTREALKVVEGVCLETPEVNTTWALIGAQIDADERGMYANVRSHLAQIVVELKEVDHRDRSSDEVIREMRGKTADISGVNSLRYQAMHGGPAGTAIELEVTAKDMSAILAATGELKDYLWHKEGVFDIADDYEEGVPELQIGLLDSARPLGLTTRTLATEVRGAFYGLEARTLQRGRDDVDIRVRFPENRRRHVYELESMRVTTPAGVSVPFCEVARLEEGYGPAAIRRVDQRRAITVTADVDEEKTNADRIVAAMQPLVDKLQADHADLKIDFAGNRRETNKSLASLKRDFMIALILIYFMLAGLFKSYLQPLVVLTAVPFGLNGAVLGHLLMGYPLTILSMIGLVALTGIVVNDSLILVDFINKEVAAGKRADEAVVSAGLRRLRPILLTSLTTVLGLAPLMAETSFQARFLIPMAISISFGLAFATILTLIVVPANFMILQDLKSLAHRAWHGSPRPLGDATTQ